MRDRSLGDRQDQIIGGFHHGGALALRELPIKLTRVIFVTAESAEAEVSQAVEGLDAAEDGVNATPVAAASGLAVTEITTN